MTHVSRLLLLPLLAACSVDRNDSAPPPADSVATSAVPGSAPAPASARWEMNPADGASLAAAGSAVTVETGPHTVLWRADAAELAPPYTVRAGLRKRHGRIHEGVGVLFGGSGLEGPEAQQRYSYFLVRGDGSFLVKRREGAETPIVRDWTRHPAIRRDAEGDEGGGENVLEVLVGASEVVFLVNRAEVARVPAAELRLEGRAGLRVSHDVRLEVGGFSAAPAETPP